MPRNSSEQFFDAVVELRGVETSHQQAKKMAVRFYDRLLKRIDGIDDTTRRMGFEDQYISGLQKAIEALKNPKFSSQQLPCFSTQAHLLDSLGQFSTVNNTELSTEQQQANEVLGLS